MDIFFCDVCAARVTDNDLRRGHGVKKTHVVVCEVCLELGSGAELLRKASAGFAASSSARAGSSAARQAAAPVALEESGGYDLLAAAGTPEADALSRRVRVLPDPDREASERPTVLANRPTTKEEPAKTVAAESEDAEPVASAVAVVEAVEPTPTAEAKSPARLTVEPEPSAEETVEPDAADDVVSVGISEEEPPSSRIAVIEPSPVVAEQIVEGKPDPKVEVKQDPLVVAKPPSSPSATASSGARRRAIIPPKPQVRAFSDDAEALPAQTGVETMVMGSQAPPSSSLAPSKVEPEKDKGYKVGSAVRRGTAKRSSRGSSRHAAVATKRGRTSSGRRPAAKGSSRHGAVNGSAKRPPSREGRVAAGTTRADRESSQNLPRRRRKLFTKKQNVTLVVCGVVAVAVILLFILVWVDRNRARGPAQVIDRSTDMQSKIQRATDLAVQALNANDLAKVDQAIAALRDAQDECKRFVAAMQKQGNLSEDAQGEKLKQMGYFDMQMQIKTLNDHRVKLEMRQSNH